MEPTELIHKAEIELALIEKRNFGLDVDHVQLLLLMAIAKSLTQIQTTGGVENDG